MFVNRDGKEEKDVRCYAGKIEDVQWQIMGDMKERKDLEYVEF